MKTLSRQGRIELTLKKWGARHASRLAGLSLGVVYLWFGILKLLPGPSPLKDLVGHTILVLTHGLMPQSVSIPLVAFWECLIGLGFLTGRFPRLTLLLFLLHIPGTLLPLVFFPGETFRHFPYDPSLEGQYIIKNLVLASGAFLVFVTMRGGRIVSGTQVVRKEEAQAKD